MGVATMAVRAQEVEGLELGAPVRGGDRVGDLLRERERLKQRLRASQERLRKLRMVKIHSSKVLSLCAACICVYLALTCTQASVDELAALTSKWRCVAQTAAEQLAATVHPPPSMADMLAHMHIDPSLMHYCPSQDAFY